MPTYARDATGNLIEWDEDLQTWVPAKAGAPLNPPVQLTQEQWDEVAKTGILPGAPSAQAAPVTTAPTLELDVDEFGMEIPTGPVVSKDIYGNVIPIINPVAPETPSLVETPPYTIAFDPDGNVRIWDAASGTWQIASVPATYEDWARQYAQARENPRLVWGEQPPTEAPPVPGMPQPKATPGAIPPSALTDADLLKQGAAGLIQWREENKNAAVPSSYKGVDTPEYEALEALLRSLYPDRYASGNFYEPTITAKTIEDILAQARDDPEGFIQNLYDKGWTADTERLLRLLGASDTDIAEIFGYTTALTEFKQQQAEIDTQQQEFMGLVNSVWNRGQFTEIGKFIEFYEARTDLFIRQIRTGDRTPEKERLLRILGYTTEQIEDIFAYRYMKVPIDGNETYVTVGPDGRAFNSRNEWVGTYNRTTRLFTANPQESQWKDAWDAAVLTFNAIGHKSKEFFLTTIPNILFGNAPDPAMEKWAVEHYGQDFVDQRKAENARTRDTYRNLAAASSAQHEEWLIKHPELAPPPEFESGALGNPSLIKNPAYWAYEFASTAPYTLAVMGATILGTLATGNPLAGILAGMAVATPSQVQDLRDALLAAGAPEDQVDILALLGGTLISGVEVAGDLPMLRSIAPAVFKTVRKEIEKEVARGIAERFFVKGAKKFAIVEITETMEEIIQQGIQNAFVKIYNRDQSLFEGLSEIAVKTFIATAPLAIIGAGASPEVRQAVAQDIAAVKAAAPQIGQAIKDVAAGGKPTLGGKLGITPGGKEQVTPEGKPIGQPITPQEGVARQPYEMTRAELVAQYRQTGNQQALTNISAIHQAAIKEAAAVGKPISAEVLKDYPALAKTIKAAPVAKVPEGAAVKGAAELAVPADEWFHGSRTGALTTIAEPYDVSRVTNLYGQGLYLTKNPTVAAGYARKTGVITRIKVKSDLKLINLDKPLPKDAEQAFIDFAKYNDAFLNSITEEDVARMIQEGKSGTYIYGKLVDDLYEMPVGEAMDAFGSITDSLSAKGYRGYTHVGGGLAGKGKIVHDVQILWHPKEDVQIIGKLEPAVPAGQARVVPPATAVPRVQTVLGPSPTAEAGLAKPVTPKAPGLIEQLRAALVRTDKADEVIAILPDGVALTGREFKGVGAFQHLIEDLPPVKQWLDAGVIRTGLEENGTFFVEVRGNITAAQRATLEGIMRDAKNVLIEFTDINGLSIKTIEGTPNIVRGHLREAKVTPERVAGAVVPPSAPPAQAAKAQAPQPGDAKNKLVELVKKAKPARKMTEQLKHEELSKRVAVAAGKLEAAEGREAFRKSTAALKGQLPEADFEVDLASVGMTEADVEELFNIIKRSDLRYFEKLNTATALDKILGGQIPTESELTLLEKMFGPELVEALLDKASAWAKGKRALQDIMNIPRTLETIFDLSATLRQGIVLAFGQPVQFGQAFVAQIKSVFSAKNAALIDQENHRGQYAELREDSKLYIAPLSQAAAGVAQREESFMSKLIQKIPVIGPIVRVSERAYVNFLNTLRVKTFDYYAARWEGTGKSVQDYRNLASFINHATGRGELGGLSGSAGWLNGMFFSPRFVASRIQVSFDIFTATPAVRKVIARNLVSFVAAGTLALMLAKLGGAETEDDPRSADFGKIKVGPNRWDFWGGFLPYVRLVTQLIREQRKVTKTGAIVPVDREEILINFFRSKEAPFVGFLHDLIRGETFLGDELKLSDADKIALERLSPMFLNDLLEAIELNGLAGIGVALPSLFGVNVQTYADNWNTNGLKLGISEKTLASGQQIIYDTKDYYNDTLRQVGDATLDMLKGKRGVPDRVLAIVEAREIKKSIADLPSTQLYTINADPEDGPTYEQYYYWWLERQQITDEKLLKEFDDTHPNAYKGNFSQITFALLKEYNSITDDDARRKFLKEHPELKIDPRDDWLKSHPEENAKLAIWGQEKLLTPEALAMAQELMKKLDIPPAAYPDMSLPKTPETIKGYGDYIKAADEFGNTSWEAKLIIAKDEELRKFLGREPIDTPIPVLELKVKNRALYDQYDNMGIPGADGYIEDNKARDEARKKLKADPKNAEWVNDLRRIDVYENNGDAATAEAWVERGKVVDEFGALSNEAKLWLLDHPDIHKWALENKLITDNGSDWVRPILEIKVADRELTDKYEGMGEEARAAMKADPENAEWVDNLRRIDALEKGGNEQMVAGWVERGQIADKYPGYSAEEKLWLYDHPDVWQWALENKLTTDNGTDWNIPAMRIDVKYRKEDAEYDALKTDAERQAYLALDEHEQYRKDRRRREAYRKKDFPPELVEAYVSYYEQPEKGYRDERFLFENPNLAKALNLQVPERVPAVQYDDITDQYRDQFDELEGNGKFVEDPKNPGVNINPYYIEDPVARAAADNALMFTTTTKTYSGMTFTTKALTEFGEAYYRRQAYAEFVPDNYIENAVNWKRLQAEGKPADWKVQSGTDYWYEDDWYMMEHIDYYREVYINQQHHDRLDFTKVPTRPVFKDYLGYVAMPDSGTGSLTAKRNYRRVHPDLDYWMVNALGYAPLSGSTSSGTTGGTGVGAAIIP